MSRDDGARRRHLLLVGPYGFIFYKVSSPRGPVLVSDQWNLVPSKGISEVRADLSAMSFTNQSLATGQTTHSWPILTFRDIVPAIGQLWACPCADLPSLYFAPGQGWHISRESAFTMRPWSNCPFPAGYAQQRSEDTCLGLGVFQVPNDTAHRTVLQALDIGYRHVDTAAYYQNEEGVGRAVRESGVPREEIFVTTKLWNSDHGFREALAACDRSLRRSAWTIVDLYLIHWPRSDRRVETWKALERLIGRGEGPGHRSEQLSPPASG